MRALVKKNCSFIYPNIIQNYFIHFWSSDEEFWFVWFQGKLVLTNTEDGTEHVYHLHGRPEKPLALDHVVIKCDAKKRSVT